MRDVERGVPLATLHDVEEGIPLTTPLPGGKGGRIDHPRHF